MSNHILRNVGVVVGLGCSLVAIDRIPWPTEDTVTTNLPDQWRHLDPNAAPTTTAHTLTSGPQRATTTTAAKPDEITIVYGSKVVHVTRSPLTAYLFQVVERMAPG